MARTAKKEKKLTPEEKLTQALVSEADIVHSIPDDWKWINLQAISQIRTGKKDANYGTPDGQYFFFTCAAEPIRCDGYSFEGKSILLAGNGDISNISLYEGKFEAYQRTYVLNIIPSLNTEYIYYYFKYRWVDYNIDKMFGTAIPYIRLGNLQGFPIPLAPIAEQQRIVDRIESLFAKLDEAREKAQVVVDGFEDRKAAILHKAFTGELTAGWRENTNPLPAKLYLQNIIDNGECFSRKEFKYWTNESLPNGWAESKIGNLLYFAGRIGWKGLKAEEYTEEGPLLLSVYNLNDGDEVTYHRVYHITEARYEESPEIMVQVGDVLLTKDGAGIGKLGYVKELPQKATINSSLLLIRPANAAISKYIYYILLGPNLQRIVKERITGSATPHLFQRDIKDFTIPVPSLDEQRQIVHVLDEMLNKEQQAKEAAEQVISQIDIMKKSILARAFRGELGTNDPTDESAVELLKRVL